MLLPIHSSEFYLFALDGYECVALNRDVTLAKKVQVNHTLTADNCAVVAPIGCVQRVFPCLCMYIGQACSGCRRCGGLNTLCTGMFVL